MTVAKRRIMVLMLAAAGALAASPTLAASDAHAASIADDFEFGE